MTDSHCHVAREGAACFVADPRRETSDAPAPAARFAGVHPWDAEAAAASAGGVSAALAPLRALLAADPAIGVGEIGLDRLKSKTIAPAMREMFDAQLAFAAEFRRPAVVHGAKCWGETVAAVRRFKGIPAVLFHGFSRSPGLIAEIAALGGFVSVGPAILNSHAVNYRELAKSIPAEMLLAESDCTAENAASTPRVSEVVAALAALRGVSAEEMAALTDANAARFASALRPGAFSPGC